MNPYPLVGLNHFTILEATVSFSIVKSACADHKYYVKKSPHKLANRASSVVYKKALDFACMSSNNRY